MLSGRIVKSLMVTGGISILSPRLTDTGIAATNDKHFVGIPTYRSNILAEYQLPRLPGVFVNANWQHVGRRPLDDINSAYTPEYDVRPRRSLHESRVGTSDDVARHGQQRHRRSLLVHAGPGSITGQSTGAYLGHLGEPRLVTASMRFDF